MATRRGTRSAAEASASAHTSGLIIAKRFRLDEPIGQGGMSSIWSADDLVTGGRVAVKLMAKPERNAEQMLERFRREAGLAQRLRGPNFVAVVSFGDQDSTPYIAMQLLTGETLQARLSRVGTLPMEDCSVLLEDLAAGLSIAHAGGIIHRDLKPANIFFSKLPEQLRSKRTEVVKILDFGIARSESFAGARLTEAGNIVGSLHYMSPEQANPEVDADARSDLWQVGALLYRALSGRRPFEGSAGKILTRLAREEVAAITSVNPELPRGLDAFFARALARDRDKRYATIAELLQGFRDACKQLSGTRPAVRHLANTDRVTLIPDRGSSPSQGSATIDVDLDGLDFDTPPRGTSAFGVSRPSSTPARLSEPPPSSSGAAFSIQNRPSSRPSPWAALSPQASRNEALVSVLMCATVVSLLLIAMLSTLFILR